MNFLLWIKMFSVKNRWIFGVCFVLQTYFSKWESAVICVKYCGCSWQNGLLSQYFGGRLRVLLDDLTQHKMDHQLGYKVQNHSRSLLMMTCSNKYKRMRSCFNCLLSCKKKTCLCCFFFFWNKCRAHLHNCVSFNDQNHQK